MPHNKQAQTHACILAKTYEGFPGTRKYFRQHTGGSMQGVG